MENLSATAKRFIDFNCFKINGVRKDITSELSSALELKLAIFEDHLGD